LLLFFFSGICFCKVLVLSVGFQFWFGLWFCFGSGFSLVLFKVLVFVSFLACLLFLFCFCDGFFLVLALVLVQFLFVFCFSKV